MFAIERIERIRQILYEQKHIDVSTLSEILNVSDVTIRRDLERLEKDGFLSRTYGGAVIKQELLDDEKNEEDFDSANIKEKKIVAMIASQFIENGEAIFIGSGTTCLQIAKLAKKVKMLTVVTNDITTAAELMHNDGIKVILIGGELSTTGTATAGPMAEQLLKMIYVNKAFIGVRGISIERGYTVYDYNEAMIYKMLFSMVKEVIIVADSSKFGKADFAQIAPLNAAHRIVTNNAEDGFKKYFFENNVKLYTTFQFE